MERKKMKKIIDILYNIIRKKLEIKIIINKK